MIGNVVVVLTNFEMDEKHAWENTIYFSHKQEITTRLGLEYGLRGTAYSLIGASKEFIFDDPDQNVKKTIMFKANPAPSHNHFLKIN